MFSPRSASRQQSIADIRSNNKPKDISIVLCTSIATEHASLRKFCPKGIYVTPSSDTLLRWDGVMFVHEGPYADAILRFSIHFEMDFPMSNPVIKFGPDVYHFMIDPKTLVWSPRGDLSVWRPGDHHVIQLLHSLKMDFDTSTLESISEEEAVNKQLYLLYKNSYHTFISMTAQRSRHSSSHAALFSTPLPDTTLDHDNKVPPSPTGSTASRTVPSTPTKASGTGRVRLNSGLSSMTARSQEETESTIRFRQLDGADESKLRAQIKERYG